MQSEAVSVVQDADGVDVDGVVIALLGPEANGGGVERVGDALVHYNAGREGVGGHQVAAQGQPRGLEVS